jgi:hypothetical protein
MMKPLFGVLLGLLAVPLLGQPRASKSKSVDIRNATSAKWTFTPVFAPNVIVNGNSLAYTYNEPSEVIQLGQNRVGLSLERFYPNHNHAYGLDVVVEQFNYLLNEGQPNNSNKLYKDHILAVRPYYSINTNKLLKQKFNYLDIGPDLKFLLYNQRYNYAFNVLDAPAPDLKKVAGYLMVRIGQKSVYTNHFMFKRVGHSRLELEMSIPLFELGNRIAFSSAEGTTDSLFKATYSPGFFSIRYAESLDFKKRGTINVAEVSLPKNKFKRFLLAPVNYDAPLTPIFGGFYVGNNISSFEQKIWIKEGADTFSIKKASDRQLSLGYNIGLLGNYQPFYSYNKNFWHTLLNVGIRTHNVGVRDTVFQYYKGLDLEGGVSFQYGFLNKFVISAGFNRLQPLRTRNIPDGYDMLYTHRNFARVGIGFGHGINFTVEAPLDHFDKPGRLMITTAQLRFGF